MKTSNCVCFHPILRWCVYVKFFVRCDVFCFVWLVSLYLSISTSTRGYFTNSSLISYQQYVEIKEQQRLPIEWNFEQIERNPNEWVE